MTEEKIGNISEQGVKYDYGTTPEGWHWAVIEKAEKMPSRFNPSKEQIEIVFGILTDVCEDCRVVTWFNPTLHSKSNFYKFLKILFPGEDYFNEIMLGDLVGKEIEVQVKHFTKGDGRVYANPVGYRACK